MKMSSIEFVDRGTARIYLRETGKFLCRRHVYSLYGRLWLRRLNRFTEINMQKFQLEFVQGGDGKGGKICSFP